MNQQETISKPVGQLSWILYDENGNEKANGMTMNQVQTAHATAVATQVDSSPALAAGLYQFMKCGTGAMGGVGATDLTTPCAGARTAVTSSTSAGAVVTTVCTFGAGTDSGTLTEIGMFSTLATATMMTTATIAVTKAAGDSLQATWTVTYS